MDFATKFNRLSGDMAFRAFRGNQSGNPDDEAQLFGLIQECFTNLEMKSVRLSEIPKMFEGAYARSLTTKRNLTDIFQSPNDFGLLCTVKRSNQLVWLEPSPEFAEFNRIAQEMRKYFLPEAQQPAKPGSQAKSQAQPKAQTKTNTNANNATSFQPPSAAETKQYEERILPKDVPLEDTPHYKMFVVEFAETLRNNFQDVEFAIEDHTTLLWLYLLHMCTIADNNRYRVSLSELPELFREFYHKKLDLPQKLVTTLQEDCYLVCQVEKFKNDLHVKPSDELVHFLDSDVGYALQDVIAENLMAVQDRYEMLSWDESEMKMTNRAPTTIPKTPNSRIMTALYKNSQTTFRHKTSNSRRTLTIPLTIARLSLPRSY
jgi:hypothetical protein